MNKPVYVRIDNRLLHGQVVQFWIPHLKVDNLLVADDEVFSNNQMQLIYRLALPADVAITFVSVDDLASEFDKLPDNSTSLVLIRSIENLVRARGCGCKIIRIMLGNIHATPERKRVTDAVYLSDEECEILCNLKKTGIEVEIQTFPGDSLRCVLVEGGCKWSK